MVTFDNNRRGYDFTGGRISEFVRVAPHKPFFF